MIEKAKNKVLMFTATSILFDSRIQKEAKTLRDAGYDVTIISIEDQFSESNLHDINENWNVYYEEMKGIITKALKLNSRVILRKIKIINKSLQLIEFISKFLFYTFREKYNYYHCHDLIPGLFAIIGKLIFSGKLIYDSHENAISEAKNSKSKYVITKIYEYIVVKFSDKIITVNSQIAKYLSELYNREIDIIENRPEQIELNSHFFNIYEQAKIDSKASVIIYAGLLTRERGLEKVVHSMAYLPENFVFVILGVGRKEEIKKWLNDICINIGINNSRLIFLESVAPSQVPLVMNKADVSVMLYPTEISENNQVNAPNKLFQSIIANVPVLASNNKSFPLYIYENGFGPVGETVNENDPLAIANKIVEIVKPENNGIYRKNAQNYSESISWHSESIKIVNLYNNLK
jgi:glycosyltransferase involved in cell wall biosynthesis